MSDTSAADLPALTRDGAVFILDLGDHENRMNPAWLAAMNTALDEIAGTAGPAALVTVARGKFWSNGLDLAFLTAHPEVGPEFFPGLSALFARLLTLGLPTVAAVQGHAFGAGAMLALVHDFRIMRADRGYFCFPEVDIGIPFTLGLSDLVVAKLPARTAHTAMITGRRYGGDEAAAAGIVDESVAQNEVVSRAAARAAELAGKAGPTLTTIKQRLFRDVAATLTAE